MILYTCAAKKLGANSKVARHPCAVAAKALDHAGLDYDIKVVGGFKNLPFTLGSRRRAIVELTGQNEVPVLVKDDGTFITGSQNIADWATMQKQR